MTRSRFIPIAAPALTLSAVVLAGGGPTYDLSWHTIDGGGGTSTEASFTLVGTIGQADAATSPMSGGGYTLDGGFLAPLGAPAATCFADVDLDGLVGINDFLLLLAAWGTDPGGPPDLDGDGVVGINDFLQLLAAWGPC